jgi:hypothetical protein
MVMNALRMFALLSAFLATPSAAQPSEGGDALNLICQGQGEKMTSDYTSRLEWDKHDHRYRARSGYETHMKDFDTAVTIQIQADDGRIRLPEKLIPPLNSGGDHQHWWQLHDILMTDNEIRASYKLNGLNHPKLRIDRASGIITIKGTGQNFEGRCDKIDVGTRRF